MEPSGLAADGQQPPAHVAILSSPGMGHLIPLFSLAKLLALNHGLSVTLITYSDFSTPSQHSLLSSLPPSISSLSIPPIPIPSLPSNTRIETHISVLIAHSVPHLATALSTLKSSTNLVAYVVDIFGGDTLPIAKQLHIPHYMLCTSNFYMLSFMFHLPTLHETTSCEFRHLPEPVELPGCVPLKGEDFLDPIQDRSNEAYEWVVHIARRFREVDGMLVNSFEALEPDAARILRGGLPPAYAIGPVCRSGSVKDWSAECLDWLDRQPRGSVLFVSFGSGGTLTCEQLGELALGLEASRQRFLLVARVPSDSESSGTFFGAGSDDPLKYLPEGFLSRTRESGLVVPNWVPQMEVLGHVAVGGFLTHCGWNSTLESLMCGVPMIAWPLYAEQRMNAVLLTEGVKVAIRLVANEKGLFSREEISKVTKELMEGEKGKAMAERVRELKEAGLKALEKEGSSYNALAEVVNKWKNAHLM